MKWLVSTLWGLIVAVAISFIALGILAGMAWIFLFGDDPWPKWAETFILVPAVAAGIVAGGLTGWALWTTTGKVQETSPRDARVINWLLLLGAVGLAVVIAAWGTIDPAWASRLSDILIVMIL